MGLRWTGHKLRKGEDNSSRGELEGLAEESSGNKAKRKIEGPGSERHETDALVDADAGDR